MLTRGGNTTLSRRAAVNLIDKNQDRCGHQENRNSSTRSLAEFH
jgi:hypothetical protein